jgi:putative Mg2+ transporter-C (MgtC) family protein
MKAYLLAPDDWQAIGARLILALVLGGFIGWNRQKHHRAAGLRTHMLVSLGAAVFVMLPLQMQGTAGLDALGRTVQGVATGVGFLGAGEIIQVQRGRKASVTGLTSAASLWVTAALGMVAGCGLWVLGVMATGLTLLTLGGMKWLEKVSSDRFNGREEDLD